MLAKKRKKLNASGKPATHAPRELLANPKKTKSLTGSQSRKRTGAGGFAPEGLTPLPHQIIALNWILENFKKNWPCYYAADAGLGKTIVAAMLANALPGSAVFYVCPPFLLSNTDAEFTKWCFKKNLYLIPDSMITRPKTFEKFLEDLKSEINAKHIVFIVDEAHRFKNEKAKRTKALFKGFIPFIKVHGNKILFMSGTPLPNSRAIELWPVLYHTVSDIFGKAFFPYGLKYCGGYRDTFGWNFQGFTNRKEFRARITKSFMLRQKKSLIDLPPKVEGLLTVGEGIPPVISKIEKKILEHYSPEDLMEGRIAKQEGASGLHLATYLRLLGEYKVKHALPYLESLLEETKENILIFAVHKETIARLSAALSEFKPLVITGDVDKSKRQALVQEFQTNEKRRVFIGNISACGVGFTLTKATRVVFVEFSWVDGDNTQASDRAHRIGQHQTVFVQYVVLKNSIDRKRMETLLKKRQLSI